MAAPFFLDSRSQPSLTGFLFAPISAREAQDFGCIISIWTAPSNWFRYAKRSEKQSSTKASLISRLAAGILLLLIVIAVVWQLVPSFQESPLLQAIRQNNLQQAQDLLRKGADPNVRDNYGVPAVVKAAEGDRLKMVKLLLDSGANVDIKTRQGRTALMLASRKANEDIAKVLLDRGADTNLKDNEGRTALMMANLTIMKLL